MVSAFLVFVAALSFSWGALLFYNTSASGFSLSTNDWFVVLLYWCIASVCLGSAAILDGIQTATRKMYEKLDELAGKPD